VTSRSRSRGTKEAVLAALANGDAMTAGEVAAATGLGRGSVSTTLSKLAKSGETVKADRGYKLPAARSNGRSKSKDS
jgi:biotin operon repressor